MIQPTRPRLLGDFVREDAESFPLHKQWTEQQYLALDTNRLVELNDGKIEVLPMPTQWHQMIALFLYEQLRAITREHRLGLTLAAPLRIRLWPGKFREPDVVFMLAANKSRRGDQFWDHADLVMEVVSDDDPPRELVTKRDEYAKSGIAEYWIVDPRDRSIRVLTLDADTNPGVYREMACYALGQIAESVLLPVFRVELSQVFDETREF